MNELKIFKNQDFGEVRTIVQENEPWFVGKDVAKILGYTNTAKAIRDHIDTEDKLSERFVLSGQNREVIIINESGLYSLILSSKLPNAKKFKRWVTSEVLPSIRKHGAYLTDNKIEEILTDPDTLIKLATDLKEERLKRKELEVQATINQPKINFANCIETSEQSILVGEMAKLLKQNGVEIGQNRLFSYLRENGYLIKKKGESYNMPTQKSMKLGVLQIKEGIIPQANGSTRITKTPKVTGKGQIYFINKLKAQ